ncbi:MAG: hypothetical protein ABS76_28225 [Pelagibacterium sp. SCN 64-44]|nr:MAG: hypothetical protein ABS76_28225 [Pelagibacterium sp. SCN 64-44]
MPAPAAATDPIHDVAVIGGGITGAAAAQALAQAGYSVVLLEADDFAAATTSRTSRLQYCGLAYLFDFHQLRAIFKRPFVFLSRLFLVRRSMVERRHFLHTYPHRLKRVPFYIPLFEGDPVTPAKMRLAMMAMQAIDPLSPFEWQMIEGQELERLPVRSQPGKTVIGAVRYYDYAYAWPERVCLDILAEARAAGAVTLNYMLVRRMRREDDVWSIESLDRRRGETSTIRARRVFNCAGPWLDSVAKGAGLDTPALNCGEKGANVALQLPARYASIGLQVRDYQGAFYLIPWNDIHYVGPVNTITDANEPDSFRVTAHELERLKALIATYLPDDARQETLFSWAGTRPRTRNPVTGGPAAEPKLHGPDVTKLDGYFAYSGGLLMMYRSIGREILRAIRHSLPKRVPAYAKGSAGTVSVPSDADIALTPAGIRKMVREEGAWTLADILFRRTGLGWNADMGTSMLEPASRLLGVELGWTETERIQAVAGYFHYLETEFGYRSDR